MVLMLVVQSIFILMTQCVYMNIRDCGGGGSELFVELHLCLQRV